jgi:trehalose 6-phosphate synthase/phosphatase
MMGNKILTNLKMSELLLEYRHAEHRLILLDYDGTLVKIQNNPSDVIPSLEVVEIVRRIASEEKNTVAIITGRDSEYISQWFGNMNVYLFTEHGAYSKEPTKTEWVSLVSGNQVWKSEILTILEKYKSKVHGVIIEERASSISWHYRNVSFDDAYIVTEDLLNCLNNYITEEMNILVVHKKRVVEIRKNECNKGTASEKMIQLKNFEFILSVGDDITDENMFNALPSYAYSFKVGSGITKAKMNLENQKEVIELLKKLS